MFAYAVQVAADTQLDELISQLSHLTQPEATGSDEGGSQTEKLIAQVQSKTLPRCSTQYADPYPDRLTSRCTLLLHKASLHDIHDCSSELLHGMQCTIRAADHLKICPGGGGHLSAARGPAAGRG